MKRKKLYTGIFVLCTLFLLTLSGRVFAVDTTDYTIDSSGIITNYTGAGGNITIPDNINGTDVKGIGENAFQDCLTLTGVVIPTGVTIIDIRAFDGCTKLATVSLPTTLLTIGDWAFESCSKLGGATIPNSVTTIGNYAFENCTALASITIPTSVTNMGVSVFHNCSSLTGITLPDSVTSIGEYAFQGCEKLASISIPSSVLSIGNAAFYDCTSLLNITIPDSVTSIGEAAFFNCTSLQSVILPSGLTNIGDEVFKYCSKLTGIDLPSTIQSIGDWAFQACSMLASLTLPPGLLNIGDGAFYGCSNLTSLIIPDGITSLGSQVFENCSKLASLTIPSGLFSIGEETFKGCSSLVSLTLPTNLLSIGQSAFQNCSSLLSLSIPSGISVIDTSSFQGCSKLTSILLPTNLYSIGNQAFYNCSSLTSISIPTNLTSLGNDAFYNCDKLIGITLPANLISLGDGVFNSCSSLVSANISAANITSIGDSVFQGCSSLISLTLPSSVISIGENAFNGCSSLISMIIPSGVTSLGNGVFQYCSKLTGITLPTSITSIGESAFKGCSSLVSIVIPSSITSIDFSTFQNCVKLANVTIPSTITSIGNSAFQGCTSLVSITIPSSVLSLGNAAFYDCSKLTSIVIPSGITSLGNSLFASCENLTSVTIPAAVTTIGDSIFNGCSKLAGITLPDELTSIGDSAFQSCSALTKINIPENVTDIGGYGFYNCTNLLGSYFYGNAPTMGSDVFKYAKTGFTVYYLAGKSGFSNPWHGYPTKIFSTTTLTPPTLTADTTNNAVGQVIELTFTDDSAWRSNITGITKNGSSLASGNYTVTAGKISITSGVFTTAGTYTIVITATGYTNASVSQVITAAASATVTINATDAIAGEAGTDTGRFTVTRTGSTASVLTVYYTKSGTAVNGTDYNSLGTSVVIAAGSATATITVTPKDDSTAESNESVIITLAGGSGYTIGSPSSATVTIYDNDKTMVSVSATDASAGEAGPDSGKFTFTRAYGSTASALTINYAISGTAVNGTDYNTIGNSVTIPAGATTATVTVTPKNDSTAESNETVIVTLAGSSAYNLGPLKSATLTIYDNDKTMVTVKATDPSASEVGPDSGKFTFTRAYGSTASALTINYTISGTAVIGTDYNTIGNSVTIPAGATTATVTVTPKNDSTAESNETVIVTLAGSSAYNLGQQKSATLTIYDNDKTMVTVKATDPSASEIGPDSGKFTFTRAYGSTASALTINYTISGTAVKGTDYNTISNSVTIPAGATTATVTVMPKNDSTAESNETVIVTLAGSSAYNLGQQKSATLTIYDNDKTMVSVSATDPSASEVGSDSGKFTFTRAYGSTAAARTVYYSISGTATNGSDYNTIGNSVTIPAGATTATVTVTPKNDSTAEGNETVIVTILSNSAYNIGPAQSATVTIFNNNKSTVTISATDDMASETSTNSATGKFTVTRTSGSTTSALTLYYTVSGTATSGTDYNTLSGSVTIPAGYTSATITVIPKDDTALENNETVILTLTANTAYNLGTAKSATVTIYDNDKTLVYINATDSDATEAGTNTGMFKILRNFGNYMIPMTFYYTASGTADNGIDYNSLPGSVSMAGGVTEAYISIKPVNDSIKEGYETAIVTLITDANKTYNILGTGATVTIIDND